MNNLYQKIIFFMIIFIISYFIYIYPFDILNYLLINEKIDWRKSFLYSLIICIIVIFYFRSKNSFFLLKLLIYEGMGVGFISFCILNIFLIINYFQLINKNKLGIIALFIIVVISLIGFLFGRLIFIKNIKITSNKIINKSKFIFISDVHLGTNSIHHLQRILNKIKKLQYDYILIGGDLIDSSSFNISKLLILKKQINKPIYFVTGNHEYYIKDYTKKINQLSEYGISILKNTNIILNDINLIGLDDKLLPKDQISNYLKLKKDNKYNLLLVHKPSIWVNIQNKNDLMLSGHCHNGQIMPFNLLVRLQFKYIYGLYKFKNSFLYISSGSSCWGPRLRVGTYNEIVNFEINPSN